MEHFRGSRPGTIEVAFPRSRGTSGLPNNVAQTLCAKQQLSRGPPGVVVRHEAAAGSCSPSRLPSQRRAPHSEPGAAAQGDAGGPGSGEQRVRRGAKGGMSQGPPSVYHEQQRLELCAVHALNNVLQQRLFSQEAADEICKR